MSDIDFAGDTDRFGRFLPRLRMRPEQAACFVDPHGEEARAPEQAER